MKSLFVLNTVAVIGGTTLSCEDNIKTERRQINFEGMKRIHVAQDQIQWEVVINLEVP
jgi:hypothetical protein